MLLMNITSSTSPGLLINPHSSLSSKVPRLPPAGLTRKQNQNTTYATSTQQRLKFAVPLGFPKLPEHQPTELPETIPHPYFRAHNRVSCTLWFFSHKKGIFLPLVFP